MVTVAPENNDDAFDKDALLKILQFITKGYKQAGMGDATMTFTTYEITEKVINSGAASGFSGTDIYKVMNQLGFEIVRMPTPDNFDLVWMLRPE